MVVLCCGILECYSSSDGMSATQRQSWTWHEALPRFPSHAFELRDKRISVGMTAFSRASAMQSFVTEEGYWVVSARKDRRHRLVFRMLDFGLNATEVKEAFEKAIWKIKSV